MFMAMNELYSLVLLILSGCIPTWPIFFISALTIQYKIFTIITTIFAVTVVSCVYKVILCIATLKFNPLPLPASYAKLDHMLGTPGSQLIEGDRKTGCIITLPSRIFSVGCMTA